MERKQKIISAYRFKFLRKNLANNEVEQVNTP